MYMHKKKYHVSCDKDMIFQSQDNAYRIWLRDSEGPLLMCFCSLKWKSGYKVVSTVIKSMCDPRKTLTLVYFSHFTC